MLTIDIRVNGLAIHHVTIINRGPTIPGDENDPDGECCYDYTATYRAEMAPQVRTGHVHHRRDRGAYDLAATVLDDLRGVNNTRDGAGHGHRMLDGREWDQYPKAPDGEAVR